MASVVCDSIDIHILEVLQADGRLKNLELADRIGFSPPAETSKAEIGMATQLIEMLRADWDPEALKLTINNLVQNEVQLNYGLAGSLSRKTDFWDKSHLGA